MTAERVSAVVVGYLDPAATVQAILSLQRQTWAPDEILVVDNHPARSISGAVEDMERVRVVSAGSNLGYTRGVNAGAAHAVGDWLVFLNPDAVAEPDALRLLLEAGAGADVAIVGAQVLLPDGRVNAGENPINLAGVSWSGGYGRPRERGPARDAAGVSGAALLVRRRAFEQLGGLCPDFFLYQDDADLCWRARLAGWRVRYCPEAAVAHDFEFDRGGQKWFYLERNREWMVLANLGPLALVLLAPVLLATEVAVTARAVAEGWLGAKVRSWGSLLANARNVARRRRWVQSGRRVPDREVLGRFRGGVETDLIESALLAWANPLLERYRRFVLAVLGWARA